MTRLFFAAILFVFTLSHAVGNPAVKNDNPTDGCVCEKFGCSCCLYMDVPTIWLNDTACITFGYDPDSYGISFVFTIDDKALINETISARDPPPICYPVPVIEDFVDVCVHFTDLSISNDDFHGCVALEFRMWWVYVVAEYKLGCFDTNKSLNKCKKPIEEVKINEVPVFHNLTVNGKHKYNLVPMQDMMPVNEAEDVSDSPKDVSFHLSNGSTDARKEDVNSRLLNLTTVAPNEDVKFQLLNVTTVSSKGNTSFHLFNVTTVPLYKNIQVNGTISKLVISTPNSTVIPEWLPICAGNSNFIGSLPHLLFLVVLQIVAINLIKFF